MPDKVMLLYHMKSVEMVPEVAIQKGLNVLREELLKVLHDNLLRIVLFGSRAESRFRPDSDVDLLVVVKRKDPAVTDRIFSISEEVEERFFLQDYSFSIHLYDHNTFNDLKRAGSLFIKDIESKGLTVYERKAES